MCSQLGYDFGSLGSSSCGRYGGNNLCGAPGSAVAMADLTCSGAELDIRECSFQSPSTACLAHELDAIVFCGMNSHRDIAEGETRLIDVGGAPSLDGIGRLEVFHQGAWGPVCRSGFTLGSLLIDCPSMYVYYYPPFVSLGVITLHIEDSRDAVEASNREEHLVNYLKSLTSLSLPDFINMCTKYYSINKVKRRYIYSY